MIKVEHTKKYPTDKATIGGIVGWTLVADAKLILVECKPEEALLVHRNTTGVDIINHYRGVLEGLFYKYLKPILISKTEKKVYKHEWFYNIKTQRIFKQDMFDVLELGDTEFKIIALPEHFSSEQLQMIVDGKLKDGDKVLVECEKNIKYNKVWWCEEHKPVKYKNLTNVIPTSIYQEGGTTQLHYKVYLALPTGEMKVDLDEIEIEEINQLIIKLNPHITIHPVEERIYTMSQIIHAFHMLNDEEFNELKMKHGYGIEKGIAIQKWFEQNVK